MKKLISILLFFSIFLTALFSCAPADGVNGADSKENGEGGASAGADQAPASEEDSVFDELGFTIFPEGNYLADPKFDTDEFLPGYDSSPAMSSHFGNSRDTMFSETDDTWYYSLLGSAPLIMYQDKGTGVGGPLCARPECMHKDENCSAYIIDGRGLFVYDNKLYCYSNDYSASDPRDDSLYSMALDGTGRTMTELPAGDYPRNDYLNYNSYAVIHRGYIFMCGEGGTVENGVGYQTVTVLAQPIDGGERFIVFHKKYAYADDSERKVLNIRIKLVGNELYIFLHSDKVLYEEEEYWDTVEVYRWSMKSRQGELLFSDETRNSVGYSAWDFYPIPGDGIYFGKIAYDFFQNESGSVYIDETYMGASKYSFKTGQCEDIELEGIDAVEDLYMWLFFSDDYIISRLDGKDYVWDHDGKLVFVSEKVQGGSAFTGADDEYVYFLAYSSAKDYWAQVAVPLDGGEPIMLDLQEEYKE